MAGHSKWANIQHRKKAQDKKRGKVFTKLIREITVAARQGGDPNANPRLRLAMDKALAANMTKDTIERAIKRGCGDQDGQQLEEIRYEGYGVGGVAVMVDCLTDNRQRTVAEVRHAFSKNGGNMGNDGSVAYLFQRLGILSFDTREGQVSEDALLEAALEAGADDVQSEDGFTEVITSPENYNAVADALNAAGLEPMESDVTMRPDTMIELDEDNARTLMKMLEALEDLDDVQEVYSNAELPDSIYDDAA